MDINEIMLRLYKLDILLGNKEINDEEYELLLNFYKNKAKERRIEIKQNVST